MWNATDVFQLSVRQPVLDEEEELKWAAIERLPTYDKKRSTICTTGSLPLAASQPVLTSTALSLDPVKLDSNSDASDNEKTDSSSSHGIEPEIISDHDLVVAASTTKAADDVDKV